MPETWTALDLLARDQMKDFQELADEAFRDLLRKHGRPTSLKEALRRSAGDDRDRPFVSGREEDQAQVAARQTEVNVGVVQSGAQAPRARASGHPS